MSTDYTVDLLASDGTTTTVKISDSINPLPGSDTWECTDPNALGAASGVVTSWGSGNAILQVAGPYSNVTLAKFTQKTRKGDSGDGTKLTTAGTFPDGDLNWTCTAKA